MSICCKTMSAGFNVHHDTFPANEPAEIFFVFLFFFCVVLRAGSLEQQGTDNSDWEFNATKGFWKGIPPIYIKVYQNNGRL